jgi:hypothetical protein
MNTGSEERIESYMSRINKAFLFFPQSGRRTACIILRNNTNLIGGNEIKGS